jgi:hypothetical protein
MVKKTYIAATLPAGKQACILIRVVPYIIFYTIFQHSLTMVYQLSVEGFLSFIFNYADAKIYYYRNRQLHSIRYKKE